MGILIVAIGRHCDRDNDPPLGRIATRPGRGSGARDGAHPVQNPKMVVAGVHGRNVGAPAANVNLRDPFCAGSVSAKEQRTAVSFAAVLAKVKRVRWMAHQCEMNTINSCVAVRTLGRAEDSLSAANRHQRTHSNHPSPRLLSR